MTTLGPRKPKVVVAPCRNRLDRPARTLEEDSGDLGQHTDLPTREVPPGFQFLHCVENTVQGGWSRMSDGWAVSEAIRAEHAATHKIPAGVQTMVFDDSAVTIYRR